MARKYRAKFKAQIIKETGEVEIANEWQERLDQDSFWERVWELEDMIAGDYDHYYITVEVGQQFLDLVGYELGKRIGVWPPDKVSEFTAVPV